MLNWIVWNGTVFDIETVLTLNWFFKNRTVWLNWIFEIEMLLTIKLCTYGKLNCLK